MTQIWQRFPKYNTKNANYNEKITKLDLSKLDHSKAKKLCSLKDRYT